MNQYKKLNNQPLKLVLAEFRFSQILKIADYIPNIQDKLRGEYPRHANSTEQNVQVEPNGSVSTSSVQRWTFISPDKRSAIDISRDRLVYVTSSYPRFDGFEKACKDALNILFDEVNPRLIHRVGLRYCDLIRVEGNIAELVDERFSFSPKLQSLGSSSYQRNECQINMQSDTTLMVRSLYGEHNLTCLPDIQNLPITVDYDTKVSERLILDFDHFWNANSQTIDFKVDDVIEKLGLLHTGSRKAFWLVTTDKARNEIWA